MSRFRCIGVSPRKTRFIDVCQNLVFANCVRWPEPKEARAEWGAGLLGLYADGPGIADVTFSSLIKV